LNFGIHIFCPELLLKFLLKFVIPKK